MHIGRRVDDVPQKEPLKTQGVVFWCGTQVEIEYYVPDGEKPNDWDEVSSIEEPVNNYNSSWVWSVENVTIRDMDLMRNRFISRKRYYRNPRNKFTV